MPKLRWRPGYVSCLWIVVRIGHKDIGLKRMKRRRAQDDSRSKTTQSDRVVRLKRAKRMLQLYPGDKASFIWYTDEKIFTVAAPKFSHNDCLYFQQPPRRSKSQVNACCVHEQHSVPRWWCQLESQSLVSRICSLLINGPTIEMLFCHSSYCPSCVTCRGSFSSFSRTAVPHRARDTVRFLEQATHITRTVATSSDLKPVDYTVGGIIQQRVYQSRVNSIDNLERRLLEVWQTWNKVIFSVQLTSGSCVCKLVCVLKRAF